MPIAVATAHSVTPAQATSASSSMSAEQAKLPSPPAAGCRPASPPPRARTRQAMRPGSSTPSARAGMRALSGRSRYCLFSGACSARSSFASIVLIPFRNEVVVKVLIWGGGGAGAGAHRARTGRGGSAPTALAVEERFRTQLGRRGGGAGLQRAAGAALVGLLCRGRSGGAGSAAPAWRQPRADQCCGLGGAKRPPARRRDRAAEGRAG